MLRIVYKQEIIYSYPRFVLNRKLKYYALAVPKCPLTNQNSPLALGRHTQWCIKSLCFKEKTSLKHLIRNLSTSGSVQLYIGSTFGICQVIYTIQYDFPFFKSKCHYALFLTDLNSNERQKNLKNLCYRFIVKSKKVYFSRLNKKVRGRKKQINLHMLFKIIKTKGSNDIEEKNMESDNSHYYGMYIGNKYSRQ